MRTQIVWFIMKVLLCRLSTRYHQVNGFGFFTPSSPPSIPLQVAANSPFPFGSGCGSPFCSPPTIILQTSPFPSAPPFFPPPYPYPPFPYPYPPPDQSPKQTLFSTILDSILSKKGNSMPSNPTPPPMQYPPQQSRIQVRVVKNSSQNQKKQNHNQNHWREEKPKWN